MRAASGDLAWSEVAISSLTGASPFIWLWQIQNTEGSSVSMTLFGFLFCCNIMLNPVRHLPCQWRENAACNEIISLLSIAFVGACSVWLCMVYEMEGSSNSMMSIGFLYWSCLVWLAVRRLRVNAAHSQPLKLSLVEDELSMIDPTIDSDFRRTMLSVE
jgi:hypothetical protein